MLPPVAAVLAAGLSRRMGTAKQGLLWGRTSLLRHVLDTVQTAGLDVFAVTRPELASLVPDFVPVVFNRRAQEGLASSVHVALGHVLANFPGRALALLLVDQPFLTAGDIEQVVQAFVRRPADCRAVRPLYDGVPGHPVILSPEFFEEALQIRGDQGLGSILAHRREVLAVSIAVGERMSPAEDVDTPDDYERARRQMPDPPK